MAWQPDYVTSAQLKAYTHIPDTVDDAQIAIAITAASRAIDRHTNRQFGLVATAEARYYTARWDRERSRWVVDVDDLMTVTGLVVKADLDDNGTYDDVIDEYALKPVNSAKKGRSWTQLVVHPDSTHQPDCLEDGVEVTARYGWTTVPVPVEQACLLQASRFFARRDAPFGVAGSPENGSEMRLLAKVDPDVAVSLGPYVRHWGAV